MLSGMRMNKSILRLAIPNIISNITVPLLGMVDIALMGHLDSAVYLGAIGLGSVIFNVLYLSFGFLRMGTTGFTAQAYGRNNESEMANGLLRSLFIAFTIAFLLIVMQIPIKSISFLLLEGSVEVKALAAKYFYIRIFAAPATLSLYAIMGWFIGMQNTVAPMIISITVNILNIVFNLFFVQVLGMDVDGVAFGTVGAQFGGLMIAIWIIRKKYRKLFEQVEYSSILQIDQLKRFFKVNSDILIRSILLILSLSFFTSQSAAISDETLAINSMILQYFFIFSYLMDGFAYAGEALVGRFIGENNQLSLKSVVKKLMLWGIVISIPFAVAYGFFFQTLLQILTNNSALIDGALPYKLWMALIPLTTFAAFIWDGIYVGATASRAMRNTMMIATLLVFIPVWYFSSQVSPTHGLWIAFHSFMLSRSILMWIFSKRAIFMFES